MQFSSYPARLLLLITIVLAIAGDFLLRVEPWGLNAPVYVCLVVFGLAYYSHRVRNPLSWPSWLVIGGGILCSFFLSWRDSPELAVLNFLAVMIAAHIGTAKAAGSIAHLTFLDHLRHGIMQILNLGMGLGLLLFRDLRNEMPEQEGGRSRLRRVSLGILLTLPALLFFGALLMSADARFEYLITKVFHRDPWTLLGHAALVTFLTWIIAGWLRGPFFISEFEFSLDLIPRRFSLGITEISILLGSLVLLFVLFVFLQIPQFFGGHGFVVNTPSLTYADYARRGVLELLAVSGLCIPLLLITDWLFLPRHKRERLVHHTLSVLMVVLLCVILGSAMHRMTLYMDAYGLTMARIIAVAFLIWVAVTLVLLSIAILREQRQYLPYAMLLSGYLILLGLNVSNPEVLVAEVNLARMTKGGDFDTSTTFHLSADAVPTLFEAIPSLTAPQRSDLAERLLAHHLKSEEDLRSWNYSRAMATKLVTSRETELRRYVIPKRTVQPVLPSTTIDSARERTTGPGN